MAAKRPLVKAHEAAEFLGVPETTLRQWRYRGVGPRWIKVESMVRYDYDDLEAYREANRMSRSRASSSRSI